MSTAKEQRVWWGLLAFLALCLGVEVSAAQFTASSVHTWYPTLVKPAWTPPNWMFGPVWTVLYALMAVAAWIVWRSTGGIRRKPWPFVAFFVQLILNFSWSMLFFGLQQPLSALFDIIALWIALAITIILFHREQRLAAWLLYPYLAWVTYATALNAWIVWYN
jgi:benzodiazapine receptor